MKGEGKRARISPRRTVSLTLLLSGVAVVVTSVVLFTGPPTHVAHFSDWRMAGLTKCQWNAAHIMTGLLFLIAAILHVNLNWRPVAAYLKNGDRKMVLFTRPFVVSMAITLYVGVGGLTGLPPMQQLIEIVRAVKIEHVRHYGVPPYDRSQRTSLRSMALYMGWSPDESVAALERKGFRIRSADLPVSEAARENGVTIGAIIEGMRY